MTCPRLSHVIVATALALAVALGTPRLVGAHGGEGILEVERAEHGADRTVGYVVRLVWEDDGHPAIDSTVTATAVGPGGTSSTPVVLEPVDQDGRYTGTVQLPESGTWTVRFTAITPGATIEIPQEVPQPPTTQSPTTVTAEPTPTSEEDSTPTREPTGSEAAGGEERAAEGTSSPTEPDEGWGPGAIAAAVVLALILGAAAYGLARTTRARRSG